MPLLLLMTVPASCEKTVLTCSEYGASEVVVNEEQVHSDKCTFSYVEIDEANEIQIAPVTVKDVDYESNVNEVDASGSIASVHFTNSRLYHLPNEIFAHFPNMRVLNCDGVNLQTLRAEDIRSALALEEFSCNSNYIKSLERKLFANSRKLQSLDLSINDIERIDEDAFSSLAEVRKLFLYDNQLSSLPHGVFRDLINLEEISLSHNQIAIISEPLFATCKRLKYIYLNDNRLVRLEGAPFDAIESLAFLELSNNQLTQLELKTSASALYANNNQLESIDLMSIGYLSFYNNSIRSLKFHNLTHVLSLNVSTNLLTVASLSDVLQLSELKSLDLSFNALGQLNVTTFLDLPELQILNLQSTNLTQIDFGLFVHQTKLEQLDISYNNLSALDINKLASLKSLTTLFVEGNGLRSLNYRDTKEALPKLSIIGYSDNAWPCSLLTSMNGFMEANGVEIYRLVEVKSSSNVDGIACEDDAKERSHEDKWPTNGSISRHRLADVRDNELTAILERMEALLQHQTNKTDDVRQTELINELSRMRVRIAKVEEAVAGVEQQKAQIAGIGESVKSLHSVSSLEWSAMKEKVSSIERALVNLKTINKYENAAEHAASSKASDSGKGGGDDFVTKAMISIIFVVVCGFVAIYIIKLYTRRLKTRDFRTYSDAETIDENIL